MNAFDFGRQVSRRVKQAQQAQQAQPVPQPQLAAPQAPSPPPQVWQKGLGGRWNYTGQWSSKPFDPYHAAELMGRPTDNMTLDKAQNLHRTMMGQYRTGSWPSDVQSGYASYYGDPKNPGAPIHPPKFDLNYVKGQIATRTPTQQPNIMQAGAGAPVQLPAGVR